MIHVMSNIHGNVGHFHPIYNTLKIWWLSSGGKIGGNCGCGFLHPSSHERHPAYGRLACLRLDDGKIFYSEEIPEEVEKLVQ